MKRWRSDSPALRRLLEIVKRLSSKVVFMAVCHIETLEFLSGVASCGCRSQLISLVSSI